MRRSTSMAPDRAMIRMFETAGRLAASPMSSLPEMIDAGLSPVGPSWSIATRPARRWMRMPFAEVVESLIVLSGTGEKVGEKGFVVRRIAHEVRERAAALLERDVDASRTTAQPRRS
jgi:hypothetical protein